MLERGGEGVIVKRKDAPYGAHWYKGKAEEKYDVVIWGYENSASAKYAPKGWIKGIQFGQWLEISVEEYRSRSATAPTYFGPGSLRTSADGKCFVFWDCGRTSGFNEVVRDLVSKNKEMFIGKAMEIKAQLRLPSLKFRHPRFSRWREDKNPEECVVKKDEC